MKSYHVIKSMSRGYSFISCKGVRSIKNTKTKAEAIIFATRFIIDKGEFAKLYVHKDNGQVEYLHEFHDEKSSHKPTARLLHHAPKQVGKPVEPQKRNTGKI